MKWCFKVFQACSKEGKDNLKFRKYFFKHSLKRIFRKFELVKISSYMVYKSNVSYSGIIKLCTTIYHQLNKSST